ncbi:DUF6188 family protein [Mycolicibacterium sp. P9-22]|uniref:DUF6188 family protein n=1 Tax=Mycolicibacterium sp. P9-22 TaxID=2024613 RepID=UPI0011ECBA2A|nr:DUF6188 family protein [Mycolicibacterium sp. P9-22]KAA0116086.1 hypothetical protein CIW51_16190 [Mycolicibacterium sp. P9-22]
MDLGLSGRTLTSHHVEYTVGLQLSDEYFVRIESRFTLTVAGTTTVLSPEVDPVSAFEPLSHLVGQVITASEVDDTGSLTVAFDGGNSLLVEPDRNYEAWTVTGPKGMIIVCQPGGELAIWHATERPDRQ